MSVLPQPHGSSGSDGFTAEAIRPITARVAADMPTFFKCEAIDPRGSAWPGPALAS